MKSRVLLTFSFLSLTTLLYRFYRAFIKSFAIREFPMTGDESIDLMLKESVTFAQKQWQFNQNAPNAVLTILIFLLIILAIAMYWKGELKRGIILSATFLVVRVGQLVYNYLGVEKMISQITLSEALQFAKIGNLLMFRVNLVIATFYSATLIYFWLALRRGRK